MSLDDIDHYTDQIKEVCDYIYLHILGEPLLHPDFENILHLLDKKKLKLQLVTNGLLLKQYPDLLSHSCMRKLSISMHALSYTSIDPSYFQCIDQFLQDPKKTIIELRFYPLTALSDQLLAYKNHLIEKYGIKETKRKQSLKIKENVYIYEEELFQWPKIQDPIISDWGYCHGGIDMLSINHEGKVGLCCLDPKIENCLGNLKTDTLKDILNSSAYQKIVTGFKDHKIVCDLCKRCSYRLRFEK